MRKFARLTLMLATLQLASAGCATAVSSCGYANSTKFLTPMTSREFGRDLRSLTKNHAAFARLVETRDAREIVPATETLTRSVGEITAYKSAVPSASCATFGASAERLRKIQTELPLAAAASDWEALRQLDKNLDVEASTIRETLPTWWWKRRVGPRIRAGL